MKLICTDDERKMLSMTHSDITSNGEKLTPPIDLTTLTDEHLRTLAKIKSESGVS